MDAVEYAKESKRMCDYYDDYCVCCPADFGCLIDASDKNFIPENAVSIVEKWSKEHPPMTYRDHFLKAFPNGVVLSDEFPFRGVCRRYVYGNYSRKGCGNNHDSCWNEPYEEK